MPAPGARITVLALAAALVAGALVALSPVSPDAASEVPHGRTLGRSRVEGYMPIHECADAPRLLHLPRRMLCHRAEYDPLEASR
jgi:hypothetical protein